MGNHFHLVIETPKANLVAGMKWLLGTYTGRLNRRHKQFGHLFSGQYESLVVDGIMNKRHVPAEMLKVFAEPATVLPPWYPGASGAN